MKTIYKCTNCGETDSDSGNNPPAPLSLLCSRKGCRSEMFPVNVVFPESVDSEARADA